MSGASLSRVMTSKVDCSNFAAPLLRTSTSQKDCGAAACKEACDYTNEHCDSEVQKCLGDAECKEACDYTNEHCDSEVQKCLGDAECAVQTCAMGCNCGATSDDVATTSTLAMKVSKSDLHFGSSSACSTASSQAAIDEQVLQRLPVVEEAIRLQLRTGASHLQKIEMAPEAYGIPRSSRSTVRKLRVDRNKALHVVGVNNLTESQNRYEGHDQKQILPPRKVNAVVNDSKPPTDSSNSALSGASPVRVTTSKLDCSISTCNEACECTNENCGSEEQESLGDEECAKVDCGASTCKVAWKCTNEDCGAEEQYFNEATVDAADFASWGGPFCGECGYKLVWSGYGL